jgi:hypothetical protein
VFRALLPSLLIVAGAFAAERPPQHDLLASSHHKTIRATLGTNCTPTKGGGMVCADYAYPLKTEERLPVHGGGRIRLTFAVAPERIYPELRDRRSRSVLELTARGSGLERRIRLPRPLPEGMDRLGVFVQYERGDADFEVDLRRHRH